jgi:hypothetical protein
MQASRSTFLGAAFFYCFFSAAIDVTVPAISAAAQQATSHRFIVRCATVLFASLACGVRTRKVALCAASRRCRAL